MYEAIKSVFDGVTIASAMGLLSIHFHLWIAHTRIKRRVSSLELAHVTEGSHASFISLLSKEHRKHG